jgi:hypothetical protein
VLGVEPDCRQRHARLHTALHLQQLDLQIHGRAQIGVVFLQSPELGDFARLGPLRRLLRHARGF